MDNNIGKVLNDRYVLNEVIGIGGMAVVYKAYDRLIDREVAIKVLKDEFVSNSLFRKRFTNESRAIAMLSHANIVDVYDVNLDGDFQYIVMEFVDGITLKQYIDKKKDLSWSEALFFTSQILNALSHAHERGIIHRDIKPHNIMLLSDGTIKVADFGIARVSKFDTVTMTEKAIGSVHYISPEQASGGKIDEKSDIYSVGVLLYEMITGVLPFEGDTPVTVALMQVQATPKKPTDVKASVPIGLEEITLKAMSKNPEKRYQSAQEMLDDIEKFKKDPEMTFGYDCFIDEAPTRAIDLVLDNDNKGAKNKNNLENFLPVLFGILTALAIFSIVIGIVYFKNTRNNPTGVIEIPDLVGKKFADVSASKDYTDKFTIIKDNDEYSNQYEEGIIINQNPTKSEKVLKGTEIRVIVSRGIRVVDVPDISNLESQQAIQQLQSKGFVPEKIYEQSDTIKEGNVIRTNPDKLVKAPYGSIVKVYISSGSSVQKVIVPGVVGIPKDDAIRFLTDKKLNYKIVDEYSDTIIAGYVISQNIAENNEVLANSEIIITVSKGKKPVSSVSSSSSSSSSSSNPSSSSTTTG